MATTLLARFLRYVQIDTQSIEGAATFPSTPGQWDLLRLLESELKELGVPEVHLNEHGYLFATLPATSPKRHIPTVALLAHVDTSPEFSGRAVVPLVHRHWSGEPLHLPDHPACVLDPTDYPELQAALGKDLVTASGTTLLGADDKAGVAILVTLAEYLLAHPEIKHGPVRLCFNPDEEVGRGTEKLDLDELGAQVAYTLDGEGPGEVSWETFSAAGAVVTIDGVATHPGVAKKRGLVNAVHLAGKLLALLPRETCAPETTEKRQGFIHPYHIEGGVSRVTLKFILRDFELTGLAEKTTRLKQLCRAVQASEPRARVNCRVHLQYRNMAAGFKKNRLPVDLAYEAIRAAGATPSAPPIRGGTDGAHLTERGLLTPNLFSGSYNWHGPLEWVAVQDMELAVRVCAALVQVWEKKGAGYKGYGVGRRPHGEAG